MDEFATRVGEKQIFAPRQRKLVDRLHVFVFLLRKAVTIFITLFIAIFLVLLVLDTPIPGYSGQGPSQLESQILATINRRKTFISSHWSYSPADTSGLTPERIDQAVDEMYKSAGLNLPKMSRLLKWTWEALTLKWGYVKISNPENIPLFDRANVLFSSASNTSSLRYTLLLILPAYLFVLLIGLPLALYLAEHQGRWMDRLLGFVAPLSSIPAWVIGVLLVTVFAVSLKWLPPSGMRDFIPPQTEPERWLMTLKHMILPVASIFLSLIFQMVYSWRTIFVTFASEDYVDMGKALGYPPRKFRLLYLLKPNLPYVITSFSLLLLTFWQSILAVEVIFGWDLGLGYAFIKHGLPNLFQEKLYPGDLVLVLQTVILFAYLMATAVFLLDVVYMLVDPRLRFEAPAPKMRAINKTQRHGLASLFQKKKTIRQAIKPVTSSVDTLPIFDERINTPRFDEYLSGKLDSGWVSGWKHIKNALSIIWQYPSAVIGLFIVLLLIAGSIYAVTAYPYGKLGKEWNTSNLSGRSTVPRLADPMWVNWVSKDKRFSYLHFQYIQEIPPCTSGVCKTAQTSYSFEFDYNYAEPPEEIFIYLDPVFKVKHPFVTLRIETPDGRTINVQGTGVKANITYDLTTNFPIRQTLAANPGWAEWFTTEPPNATPITDLFFAKPQSSTYEVVQGRYRMTLLISTFEPESKVDAQVYMFGSVYGLFGTDYYRRELGLPLFWGMPFALGIGVGGALITILLSMLLAAAGVWFGGWVDDLIQRLSEIYLTLPILAVAVIAYAFLHISVWWILIVYALLNMFGTPIKSFRAALLQIRNAPYIEAAVAYNASPWRIIIKYLIRRIIPVLVPQLIILIPGFVFFEATLGLFNIRIGMPTWGSIIYDAARDSSKFGSPYWVLQPIFLLLLTGLGFGLLGSALEKILNPRLQEHG